MSVVNWGNMYFEELREHCATYGRSLKLLEKGFTKGERLSTTAAGKVYRIFSELLDDPNTKRLLFDARQAIFFGELDEAPPEDYATLLHPPFEQFYMEFTEPVTLLPQEPGEEDRARALLFVTRPSVAGIGDLCQVTLFFDGREGQVKVDRTWNFNLRSGIAWVSVEAARLPTEDPSEAPPGIRTVPFVVGDLRHYFQAGTGPEGRRVGWWERATLKYTDFVRWLFLYMVAKSVVISPESPPRQYRRWHERHNQPIRPWHVVKVDPKIATAHAEQGPGTRHGYRYDVIGHLRLNKHRVKEGGLRETVEWVPSHQRGLENTLYIPKTYMVKAGRSVRLPKPD